MEKQRKQRIKADMMLMSVALFWGTSYLLTDYSLEELSPFNINALRFLISFAVIFIVFWRKLLPVNLETIKYSAGIGFMLMLTYLTSTMGVKYTSLSNAGFLCSLTVIFTPVLSWIVRKEKTERKLIISVLLALTGIALMTLNENTGSLFGDVLCIMCALSYAAVLLVTEDAVCKPGVNPFQLGVYQIAFAGIYQVLIALPTETLKLPQSPKVWISVLVLTVFCTGVAFVVQSVALQFTTASRAGIIFSLEPVFAALIAFFIAGEILSAKGYSGAVLLLTSLLVMEIDFKLVKGLKIRGRV